MNLNGNTILITGGSSGIGFEMAKKFLAAKNTVIIIGRNIEKLEKAKQKLGDVKTIQSDVSNPDSIKELYEQVAKDYPNLNVLINNAGIMTTINLQDHNLTANQLTKELDINVKGAIWMNDAFLPLLKKNENSAIAIVSSSLAFVPMAITPVYCASKAAIHSYTLSLRAQLKNTNVKVFELAPPATATAILADSKEEFTKNMDTISVETLVNEFIKGFSKDKYEILPGQSSQVKFMSRFFPKFILNQMNKSIDGMNTK